MKQTPTSKADLSSIVSLPLIVAVLLTTQWLEGGRVRTLFQPAAALIVFGGTFAALLLSFPLATLRRTGAALHLGFSSQPPRAPALIARFGDYAVRARRHGILTLESEIAGERDPFMARAIGLAVDGVPQTNLKQALDIDSRAREDADLESADVLEAAAGYTPTLGILGAVLGLIHVMEHLAAPSAIGAGIAVAFVATVYGVGAANLLLLPLATRLRGRARDAAIARDIIIEGVLTLQQGLNPRLVVAHLDGFVRASEQPGGRRAA
jgi:chemotaxis protein MotA